MSERAPHCGTLSLCPAADRLSALTDYAESRGLLIRMVIRAAAFGFARRAFDHRVLRPKAKLPQTSCDQLVHQGGRERLVHGKVQRPFGALVTCEIGGQRRQD